MRVILSRAETVLLMIFLGLLALALFAPAVAQPERYHAFADQRVLVGLPFAMNVLSNLPLAVAGLAGGYCLRTSPPGALNHVQRVMSAIFFIGLLLTAAASSWYHWQPDDGRLAIDRCAMAVAFAGLLGLAAAGPVSQRAGAALGLAVLLLGPLSIGAWAVTGNALPWAALQFGGVLLLLWFALLRPRSRTLKIRWSLVILAYAAAKLLEMQDHEIYGMTGERVSGHTLKHVAAALACCPVIAGIRALRSARQNAAGACSGLPPRRIGGA